jgi:hypothetical protein
MKRITQHYEEDYIIIEEKIFNTLILNDIYQALHLH